LVSDGIIDEKGLVFDPTIDMPDTPAVCDMISLYARQMGGTDAEMRRKLEDRGRETWTIPMPKPSTSWCVKALSSSLQARTDERPT
jgi:hypothetical protein